MARWDPGAEQRLKRAALELYSEHGYDNVTVTDIAERAGLTRRSYFRYFPDKREVLFGGSELLPPAVARAVLAADPGAAPLTAVLDAMSQVGAQLVAQVEGAAQRRAVIDASPELQERERTKSAAISRAVQDAWSDARWTPTPPNSSHSSPQWRSAAPSGAGSTPRGTPISAAAWTP